MKGQIKGISSVSKKDKKILSLSIYNYLKEGIRPSKIYSLLGIKRQRMQHYLSSMKKEGLIKKIGYGVWQIDAEKEGQKVSPYDLQRRTNLVRSHGFKFILENPKSRIYENNSKYSLYENIKILTAEGKRLTVNNNKVHLWPKHTIIYIAGDTYNENAIGGSVKATESLISTIRQLEAMFNISLKIRGSYRFKILRQHHSLINNEIAIDCNGRKEKVKVYAEDGKLCILIDNSLNLNELETLHPVEAVKDNNNMKAFIESARRNPNILDILSGSAIQQSKRLEEVILSIHNLVLVFDGMMTLIKAAAPPEQEAEEEGQKDKPYYVG